MRAELVAPAGRRNILPQRTVDAGRFEAAQQMPYLLVRRVRRYEDRNDIEVLEFCDRTRGDVRDIRGAGRHARRRFRRTCGRIYRLILGIRNDDPQEQPQNKNASQHGFDGVPPGRLIRRRTSGSPIRCRTTLCLIIRHDHNPSRSAALACSQRRSFSGRVISARVRPSVLAIRSIC